MEHVELAGIHSGDSACVIPPVSISAGNLATIKEYTKKIAESFPLAFYKAHEASLVLRQGWFFLLLTNKQPHNSYSRTQCTK